MDSQKPKGIDFQADSDLVFATAGSGTAKGRSTFLAPMPASHIAGMPPFLEIVAPGYEPVQEGFAWDPAVHLDYKVGEWRTLLLICSKF